MLYRLALILALLVPAQTIAQVEISGLSPRDVDPAFAEAFEAATPGRELFFDGDHDAALAELTPLAEAGNAVAMNALGSIHVDADSAHYAPAAAFARYEAAAAQGFAPAMHNLGLSWQEAHAGFGPDAEQAYTWFRRAYEAGYPPATYHVAYALTYGEGVETAPEEAFALATEAIEARDDGAPESLLGDLLYFEEGIGVDLPRALAFYKAAAEKGDAYGAWSAGYMHLYAEGTALDYDRALPLYETAVAAGETRALADLVKLHLLGWDDREPTHARAEALTLQASQAGDVEALDAAFSYWMNHAPEAPQADQLSTIAARQSELGAVEGLLSQASLALYGIGEPVDPDKSFRLSQAALEQDPTHQIARYSVAGDHMRGSGTAQDVPQALELFDALAAEGFITVSVELAVLYGSGDYGAAYDQPVLGMSHCLTAEEDFQLHPVYERETLETCAALRETLSEDQMAEAKALREARQ
ncbi:MAG: hypothetical protein ACU0CI_03270 [Shimia sp.]